MQINLRPNLYLSAVCAISATPMASAQQNPELSNQQNEQPNIIYIMADDLGMGDLGCYGQRYIKTPTIDSLANTGLRFAQHYSGSTVSAPSRSSLMTGQHTGNTFIRGNRNDKGIDGEFYDTALPAEITTVAEVIKPAGYTSACIGKWGLGGPSTSGHPLSQGFDYFYGYLGQLNAHRHYPRFLWENNTKVTLNQKVFSQDLIIEKALNFIDKNAKNPFFIYLTPIIPHADLIMPEGELGVYEKMFEGEKPVATGGYYKQPKPKATFAAMVARLDADVKRVCEKLKSLGIEKNTIIIFTSDNGTHREGGHDPYFFNSNAGFRGTKRAMYEGGIRTPFIVSWANVITEPRITDHISAFWDFMPTICDITGAKTPDNTDGISYLPTIIGAKKQKFHSHLYWEFHEEGGKQAVRKDNWKLIKLNVNTEPYYELYDLSSDPTERMNLARQMPKKVAELQELINTSRSENLYFKFTFEK